ncbi:MAG TPA: aminoacyl-tRNA hydrolase [Candidatus Saccharimonadales bacterium]|nr:aminoacyl-tRNA hydrolase [Candidatus Saccharimonadales bacterium]
MALFQKKPQFSSAAPLYTIGTNKTFLIVGLGNIGKEYIGTRHNIGFNIIDEFAKANEFPEWVEKKDLKCFLSSKNMGDSKVVLCKPTTFVNLSGVAAQAAQHFYRIYNQRTLAVYDELAIPFGQLRTRAGGSDAGHNGVKSLIQHIGEDFARLRIGIDSELAKKSEASNFVLKKFTKEEQANLPKIKREASALITEYIFGNNIKSETRTVI